GVGMGNGERAKNHGVEDGEERRVDADPKSKRQQPAERVAAILEQSAKAKSRVGECVVEPLHAMCVVRFFLDLREAAELDPGTARRLRRIHTGARVGGNLLIEVKPELLIELVVDRS